MVEELHKRNIEVLVDIVFNHTGEGGLWRDKIYAEGETAQPYDLDPQEIATLYSYRALDNASYYALPRRPTASTATTSVGNTTRTNGPAMRRTDHRTRCGSGCQDIPHRRVRFDLAPALGAKDGVDELPRRLRTSRRTPGITWDPETVVQDIVNDPVILAAQHAHHLAKPSGADGYPVGQFR